MNLIRTYPEYQINKNTSYRLPPGWSLLACALLDELEELQKAELVGRNFHVKELRTENGAMAVVLGGTYLPGNLSGILSSYADRSRKTCAECGYEGIAISQVRRPVCRCCQMQKKEA